MACSPGFPNCRIVSLKHILPCCVHVSSFIHLFIQLFIHFLLFSPPSSLLLSSSLPLYFHKDTFHTSVGTCLTPKLQGGLNLLVSERQIRNNVDITPYWCKASTYKKTKITSQPSLVLRSKENASEES